jgi:hypothetical protein
MEIEVTDTETVFPCQKLEVFEVYTWTGGQDKGALPFS